MGPRRSRRAPSKDETFPGTETAIGGTGENPASRLLAQAPVVDQHGQHLLDEQGVAFGQAEDPPLERLGQARLAEEVPHDAAALGAGELRELNLGRRPSPRGETRPVLAELVTGRADEQERHAERGVEDVLDEIEEGWLRPVDVIEDHHERPAASQLLEDRPDAPEQLVLSVQVLREADARLDAAGRVGQLLAETGLELDAGILLAVLRHDPGGLPQHLRQRPERDAVTVGQAAAAQHRRLVGEAIHELLDEPALADPGLAEQRDEPALGSGDRTAELRVEGGDLALPADERPVWPVSALLASAVTESNR